MLGVLWGILYNDYVAPLGLPLSTTLSEGLKNYIVNGVPVLKVIYIVFIVCLCFATIPASFSVLLYSINNEGPTLMLWEHARKVQTTLIEDHPLEETHEIVFLRSISVIYFLFAWFRMIPLSLVAVFDMGGLTETAHYACAFTAFALILICNFNLFMRRCVVLHQLDTREVNESTGSIYPFMDYETSYKHALRIIIGVNLIWLLLQIACAIIFAITTDGRAECALTFLVVSDMLFQPFDFYFDPISLQRHGIKEPLIHKNI